MLRTTYQDRREQIVGEVERSKVELQAAVNDLTGSMQERYQRVRTQLDVPHHVATRPVPWLAAAFGVGLLLGTRQWISRKLHGATE